MKNEITINDVIVAIWGYEQTNATFYRVTKLGKNFATVQKLKSIETDVPGGFMIATALPTNEIDDHCPTQRGMIRTTSGGEQYLRFDGKLADKWDGKPVSVSYYA